MKTKDVQIGATYLTYIGESLAPVVVLRKIDGVDDSRMHLYGFRKSRDTFEVARVGENKPLPKRRTAAALREMPKH